MASFSAELRVAGHAFPVLLCTFGTEQAIHQRGRVSTKVRHGPVQLTLSVPDNDVLFAWANEPLKQQAAAIVYADANGGSAIETLHLAAAHCVAYAEEFYHGDGTLGSYVCTLTLSDPNGWTLQAGGPAVAFVSPAAREHGASAGFERETAALPDASLGNVAQTALAAATAAQPVAAGLAAMLGTTFEIEDLAPFTERVTADLQLLYATPSGKLLLDSLHASGKKVAIEYTMGGNEIEGYEAPEARFLTNDGSAGVGTSSRVLYNPRLETIGDEPWATRPPAIALAHELIHAEQAAYGRMAAGSARNGQAAIAPASKRQPEALVRELEAVGVPPHDQYPVNENKIRREWNPPQPERDYY